MEALRWAPGASAKSKEDSKGGKSLLVSDGRKDSPQFKLKARSADEAAQWLGGTTLEISGACVLDGTLTEEEPSLACRRLHSARRVDCPVKPVNVSESVSFFFFSLRARDQCTDLCFLQFHTQLFTYMQPQGWRPASSVVGTR